MGSRENQIMGGGRRMAIRYGIIYADPPWRYKDKSLSHGGGAECHYPTMDINEICALPIKELSDENCTLFLWVTFPMLQEGLKVITSWGFNYKTCAFVWIKTNKRVNPNQVVILPEEMFYDEFMGMGRWTRANAEICLLGTKGRPARKSASVRQIIYSPVEEHSKKPTETRHRIIELMGDLPRVELFAREKTEGWDAWGNQVKSDIAI
jgi:N6-adenosine-specific RNA methylase IME4